MILLDDKIFLIACPKKATNLSAAEEEAPEELRISIPYKPREYFQPYHNRKQRYACIVAHRRAGKTVAMVADLIKAALTNKYASSRYAYIAPTYAQAKSTAFDYLVGMSAPLMGYGAKVNQTELKVNYPGGSEVRLFGADNYDTLRGLRLDGCVLDEVADIHPAAWERVISPALRDRQGFATFIGTPKGHNFFYDKYVEASRNTDVWFAAKYPASELVPAHKTWAPWMQEEINLLSSEQLEEYYRDRGLLSEAELEEARKMTDEDSFRQEFECDFEAAVKGAYYGKQMTDAFKEGRITKVPWSPDHRVYTAWDIGGDRDATAIWFAQLIGKQVLLIDYAEATGSDSAPHAKRILDKPYSYAQHFLPHDAGPNRIGIDRSYSDFLGDHGLRNITVLPSGIREHGINLVRLLLPRCYFSLDNCEVGIESLRMYQTEWDEKNKVFKSTPKHDWASHGADAFRYLAVGLDKHISSPNFNRKLNYPKGY